MNTSSNFPGAAVNWSFISRQHLVPSSPGANVMSYLLTSNAVTNLSSASARFFPTHAKRPMLKGVKARLSATISGMEYQRSGTNSEARAKDLSTIGSAERAFSQDLAFIMSLSWGFDRGVEGRERRTTTHGISWRHDRSVSGYEVPCDFDTLGGAFAVATCWHRRMQAQDLVYCAVQVVESLQALGIID